MEEMTKPGILRDNGLDIHNITAVHGVCLSWDIDDLIIFNPDLLTHLPIKEVVKKIRGDLTRRITRYHL